MMIGFVNRKPCTRTMYLWVYGPSHDTRTCVAVVLKTRKISWGPNNPRKPLRRSDLGGYSVINGSAVAWPIKRIHFRPHPVLGSPIAAGSFARAARSSGPPRRFSAALVSGFRGPTSTTRGCGWFELGATAKGHAGGSVAQLLNWWCTSSLFCGSKIFRVATTKIQNIVALVLFRKF